MKTEKEQVPDLSGSLTLGEVALGVPRLVAVMTDTALNGPIWIVKPSEHLYEPRLLRAAALYYLSQVMVEYSQLLCWLEANAYARSLTVPQTLSSFTLGSLVTFRLMDALADAQEVLDQWADQAETANPTHFESAYLFSE